MTIVALKQAVRGLRANPVRTSLTTLGVVIGIATVIVVLSAGEGFKSLINAQVDALGSNTIYVQTRIPPTTKSRANGSTGGSNNPAASAVAITTFKASDLELIRRVPNVENVYGMVLGQKVVSYRDTAKNVIFYGSSAQRFEIDKGTLKSGRFFNEAEDSGGAQVVILGSKTATDFFGTEDAVGSIIRVGELNYQVIGVYNSRGGLGGDEDSAMYIPLGTAQKKVLGIDYLLYAVVQLKDINLADATSEDIRAVMRASHNITNPDKDDFSVQTQAQALATFNVIFGGLTLLLIAIAAISLIVGGVGIMNIMYVVVTERTSEIGLKKAMGATGGQILQEFLIESVLVTVLGGILGIAAGALVSWLISVIAISQGLAWAFIVPISSIVIAVGVSAGIGIMFGVLPARSAAKLDPIEALRYE